MVLQKIKKLPYKKIQKKNQIKIIFLSPKLDQLEPIRRKSWHKKNIQFLILSFFSNLNFGSELSKIFTNSGVRISILISWSRSKQSQVSNSTTLTKMPCFFPQNLWYLTKLFSHTIIKTPKYIIKQPHFCFPLILSKSCFAIGSPLISSNFGGLPLSFLNCSCHILNCYVACFTASPFCFVV